MRKAAAAPPATAPFFFGGGAINEQPHLVLGDQLLNPQYFGRWEHVPPRSMSSNEVIVFDFLVTD